MFGIRKEDFFFFFYSKACILEWEGYRVRSQKATITGLQFLGPVLGAEMLSAIKREGWYLH